MGHQYENDVAGEIDNGTSTEVRAYRCGYSGNGRMPQPDVLVTTASQNHGMELKGPVAGDTLTIEEEDLEQLTECQNSYTDVYLVVKFQHRAPLVVQYYPQLSGGAVPDDYYGMSVAEQFAVLVDAFADGFNPRVHTSDETGVTRLYVDKPDTDDHPSAQASDDDWEMIASGLGLVTENATEV